MKKLFVVDVHHTVYVVAEDAVEAEREARHGIRENGDVPEMRVTEFTGGPIDPAWRNAVPYGSDEERTVGEIAAEMKGQ